MPIVIKDLNFTYNPKSVFETHALNGISVTVNDGDFIAVIGPTGSGKSTFVQHLNGLLRVQGGSIAVNGMEIAPKGKSKRRNIHGEKIDWVKLRGSVGMMFQYPEYQLFADSVYNDVAFGPKNLKLDKAEVDRRVREAIDLVGLNFEQIADKSPFELSGGEKRRAAIAGVIAMKPATLVLDEPAAGLDPKGRKEIFELLLKLKATCSPTIIIISHDMDAVAEYADRVIAFEKGKIVFDLKPERLFEMEDALVSMGLGVPQLAKLRFMLKKHGTDIPADCLTTDKMTAALNAVKKRSGGSSRV